MPERRKIIQAYNKLAAVLLEYEMIHHKAWVDGVELGLYGLKASLLTRHPETKVHKFIFQKTLFLLCKIEHYILKQLLQILIFNLLLLIKPKLYTHKIFFFKLKKYIIWI